jgi:DNA-binding MarR family transcriptional regulator
LVTRIPTNEACSRQLFQLVPSLMRLIRRSITQADPLMSVAQFRILDYLLRRPGSSLSEVSAELEISNPTASTHIDRLVKRDLVKRVAHPSERRRVVLTLTPLGRQRLERVTELSTAVFSDMLSALAPGKIARVQDGLTVLEHAAKQSEVRDV